ncbi:hypothetical protein EWQ83_08855 [Klebsiella pneumoniae]|nr:hypothetical protein EWP92_08655 [Klebsiella pneumoniae]TIH93939.1 hypothetical protein EWQ83_08855 [Klebsiella pneumoniae]
MFAGKKSAQIREILISESAWEEMTCLFAPSLGIFLTLRVRMTFLGNIRVINRLSHSVLV